MADINKVILVGRLTRDADLSYTQSGYALLKFSIAVNRRRKVQDRWEDEANFFDVTIFGRQGEAIVNYMKKGTQVAVDGQLRQDRWEAADGTKRSKVYVEASYVQLLGSRNSASNGSGFSSQQGSWSEQPQVQQPQVQPQTPVQPAPASSFEDDIPF